MHGKRGRRAWMRKINSTDVTSWIGTRISYASLLRNLYVSKEIPCSPHTYIRAYWRVPNKVWAEKVSVRIIYKLLVLLFSFFTFLTDDYFTLGTFSLHLRCVFHFFSDSREIFQYSIDVDVSNLYTDCKRKREKKNVVVLVPMGAKLLVKKREILS